MAEEVKQQMEGKWIVYKSEDFGKYLDKLVHVPGYFEIVLKMAAEVKQLMEGEWIVYRSEDFEDFLDKLGVGMIKKKMATSMTPKLTITVEGDVITTKIEAGLKTNLNSFKIGEEYEIEMEQGTSKALSIWEDGKLKTTITPKDSNKKEQQVVREVVAGEIIQTMTIDGTTAKRFFKKCS